MVSPSANASMVAICAAETPAGSGAPTLKFQATVPAPSPVIGSSKPAEKKPRKPPDPVVEMLETVTEWVLPVSSSVTVKVPSVPKGTAFSPAPSARSLTVSASVFGPAPSSGASFRSFRLKVNVDRVMLPALSVPATSITIDGFSSRSKNARAASLSLIRSVRPSNST